MHTMNTEKVWINRASRAETRARWQFRIKYFHSTAGSNKMPPCFTVTVTLYKRNIQTKQKQLENAGNYAEALYDTCFFRTNKQTTEWSASTARVSAANKKLPGQDHNGGIVSNVKYAACVTAVGYCVLLRVTVNVTALGYCVFLLMQWVTVVYSRLLLLLQSVDCVSLKYAAFQNNWSLLYIAVYLADVEISEKIYFKISFKLWSKYDLDNFNFWSWDIISQKC